MNKDRVHIFGWESTLIFFDAAGQCALHLKRGSWLLVMNKIRSSYGFGAKFFNIPSAEKSRYKIFRISWSCLFLQGLIYSDGPVAASNSEDDDDHLGLKWLITLQALP